MQLETEMYWLTVTEAAVRLRVNTSRIRQLLLKDQERLEELRTFPSARKTEPQEEKELRASGRVGRVPRDGVWLIDVRDVERRQQMRDPFQLGRPHKWKDYYANCGWFRGSSPPAAEALIWACNGDAGCGAAMLSETMKRFYERCMPAEVQIEGSWEEIMPKEYTEVLHVAYQQGTYGKIASLMAPFHDATGLARVIVRVEESFASHAHTRE